MFKKRKRDACYFLSGTAQPDIRSPLLVLGPITFLSIVIINLGSWNVLCL